ncbi:hypothetical protein V8E53_008629 [Lactarius tabidus]
MNNDKFTTHLHSHSVICVTCHARSVSPSVSTGYSMLCTGSAFQNSCSSSPLCSVANPPNFIKPSTPPVFVALITGFYYNYSCSRDANWQFGGSSGSAFDISSLFSSAQFMNIQFDAFEDMLNSHGPNPFFATTVENKYVVKLLGQYSDTEGSDGGFKPEVDFSSTGGGFVVTRVTADTKSPSPTAVDWLKMHATSGSLANTVLLIGTVAGLQPIDDCEPGYPPATSPFCTQLWGF